MTNTFHFIVWHATINTQTINNPQAEKTPFWVTEWIMCGCPQVQSEIKVTLLIFKHTPNSKSSLPILITHYEIQNYGPISKSSLRIRKLITLNSSTSFRIWKHHSKFANTTPNLKTPLRIPKLYFEFESIALNWKTSLQIRKLHSQFSNSTPNSQTSLPILKLHSQFSNSTYNSKTSLPILSRKPRVLELFFQRD